MTAPLVRWLGAAAAVLAASMTPPAAQAWRAPALASFDDVWRTINDTYFDPDFGGLNWAAVAAELRPRVESAASQDDARRVIREMLARLKQSHFALLASTDDVALPGPASVPIDIRIVARDVVITRVIEPAAAKSGLAPGQVILAVDRHAIASLLSDRDAEDIDSRTRNLEDWRRVNRVLHGSDGSVAALRVRDAGGRERDVAVHRSMGEGEVVTLGNLPPLRVRFEDRELRTPAGRRSGLMAFTYWMASAGEAIAAAVDRFRQHDGMVIDLRGNPGGLAGMVGGVAGHFIADPVVLGTMRTRQAELSFKVNPRLVTSDGKRVTVFQGPVAILVDELTGSTSEIFAAALQSLGRARVFGRMTMGQALPALTKQLPSGDVLMYAIGDFTPPGGGRLEGVGVRPDTAVSLSNRALADGRDEVIEAALKWLDLASRRP